MPISIEKARTLPKEKKSAGTKATEEILEFLANQAYNAAEIAKFLGIKKEGVYSKMEKLVEKDLVQRVYQEEEGKRPLSYWYVPS